MISTQLLKAGRNKILIIVSLMIFLNTSFALSKDFLKSEEFRNLEQDAQKAIQRIIKDKEIVDFLNDYPNWTAGVYADSETQWHVDFYDADEWIGNAHIDFESNELYDVYLLKELKPEAFEAGKTKIEKLVFNDAEVLAILGDIEEWGYDISFNKWEQNWEMHLWKGIQSLNISFWEDNNKFYVDEIYDPEAFDAYEALELERNLAIELAYQAEGLSEALEGVYDWVTYADKQSEGIWGVEFSSGGKGFYAVVDIELGRVIESQVF